MHPEVLDKKRLEIFKQLHRLKGFVLAGGTALALQLGHRVSFDFDFFSHQFIAKDVLNKVKRIFPDRNITPLVNNKDELTVLVDGVKTSFIYYPFSVGGKRILYQGVPLMPADWIAVTKAYTMGRRGSWKDYVDVFYALKQKVISLPMLIKRAQKVFGQAFHARLFLEQLIDLRDIEDAELIFLKKSVSKKTVQTFFEQQIKKINT